MKMLFLFAFHMIFAGEETCNASSDSNVFMLKLQNSCKYPVKVIQIGSNRKQRDFTMFQDEAFDINVEVKDFLTFKDEFGKEIAEMTTISMNMYLNLCHENSGQNSLNEVNKNTAEEKINMKQFYANQGKQHRTGNNQKEEAEIRIDVENGCNFDLDVIWDGEKKHVKISDIKPNGKENLKTFPGHKFIFKNNEKEIKRVTISEGMQSLKICESNGFQHEKKTDLKNFYTEQFQIYDKKQKKEKQYKIEIKNSCEFDVDVIWVGENGQSKKLDNLKAGSNGGLNAYLGHTFVFRHHGEEVEKIEFTEGIEIIEICADADEEFDTMIMENQCENEVHVMEKWDEDEFLVAKIKPGQKKTIETDLEIQYAAFMKGKKITDFKAKKKFVACEKKQVKTDKTIAIDIQNSCETTIQLFWKENETEKNLFDVKPKNSMTLKATSGHHFLIRQDGKEIDQFAADEKSNKKKYCGEMESLKWFNIELQNSCRSKFVVNEIVGNKEVKIGNIEAQAGMTIKTLDAHLFAVRTMKGGLAMRFTVKENDKPRSIPCNKLLVV